MKCICGSDRILSVSGKVSDMCVVQMKDNERDGYVPRGLNIGGGDYLEFQVCLDCGKHIGEFPISEQIVSEVFSG